MNRRNFLGLGVIGLCTPIFGESILLRVLNADLYAIELNVNGKKGLLVFEHSDRMWNKLWRALGSNQVFGKGAWGKTVFVRPYKDVDMKNVVSIEFYKESNPESKEIIPEDVITIFKDN